MVRRQHAQRNIFEMILPDGEKLWDPTLRRIDEVLEDEELIAQVEAALRRRRPKSRLLGRRGTPAAVALRMLVLKHLYHWSFEECEREVRASLIYRAFCRIGCEAVPDDTTLIRLNQALGPEVLKAMLERLVSLARQRKVVRGRKLRVDSSVVQTAVHSPTDSGLLADGVRRIRRPSRRSRPVVAERLAGIREAFRTRTRSARRQLQRIHRLARRKGAAARAVCCRSPSQTRWVFGTASM